MKELVDLPIEILNPENGPYYLLYNLLFGRIWKTDFTEIDIKEGWPELEIVIEVGVGKYLIHAEAKAYLDVYRKKYEESTSIERITVTLVFYSDNEGDSSIDLKKEMPEIVPVIEAICVKSIIEEDFAEIDKSGTDIKKAKRIFPWELNNNLLSIPPVSLLTIGPHLALLMSASGNSLFKK